MRCRCCRWGTRLSYDPETAGAAGAAAPPPPIGLADAARQSDSLESSGGPRKWASRDQLTACLVAPSRSSPAALRWRSSPALPCAERPEEGNRNEDGAARLSAPSFHASAPSPWQAVAVSCPAAVACPPRGGLCPPAGGQGPPGDPVGAAQRGCLAGCVLMACAAAITGFH
ncbi:unnamed protein product [Prorocentrum cordatum]|uniref:Uncharacterized protein n=1 Tax=Prorocentrum cordatum TaxID=2364126 RepID=A0ABN9QEG1_9DINO|nr:unnamed protein product [Polarella glacialis]